MSQTPIPSSGRSGILILKLLRLFYFEPLGEALIDFTGLSLSLRILSVLGYLTVFLLLVAVLGIEILARWLPVVTFMPPGDEKLVQAPIPAVLAASLAFCMGWAFLLTGATDARKRVFLPIWAAFGIQILFVMPLGSDFGMFLWCIGGPAVLLGLGSIYLLSRRWKGWRDLPLLEFIFWLGLFAAFFLIFSFASGGFDEFTGSMSGMFAMLSFVSVPFWLFYGATVVNLAVTLASRLTIRLRHKTAPDTLRAISAAIVLARPGLDGIIIGVTALFFPDYILFGEALAIDFILTILFALALPVFALIKGWTTRVASIFLTLNLTAPVFAVSLVLSLLNQNVDVLDVTVGILTRFAPLLVFVFLTTHSLLSTGAVFANVDGKIIPRSGRILIVFGASLLIIAFTIFSVNARYLDTNEPSNNIQGFSDSLFALGAFFFGLPYLIWLAWKSPDALAGVESDFPVPSVEVKPRKKLIWIAALVALVFTLSSCGFILALDQFLK